MAGAKIRIDDRAVRAAFDELEHRAHDLTPAFNIIGGDLELAHRERFDRQVSPDGVPWKPLSDEYRQRKPKRKDEILVRSTLLRDTLRYDPSNEDLVFGTDRVYGPTHQFGDADRGIPARHWLGMDDENEAAAQRVLADYLGGAWSD